MTRWTACLLTAALLVACGGDDYAGEAAGDLQQHTAAARAAAEAGDVDAARGALGRLDTALKEHAAAGRVGPRRAREIADAAALLDERLAALGADPTDEQDPIEAPQTAPPDEPETEAPEPDDDHDDKDDKDDDGDDDKGEDKDDGDDKGDEGGREDAQEPGEDGGGGPDGQGPPGQREDR